MNKVKSILICSKCKGNGYVRGSSENTGTCIHCFGSGHGDHDHYASQTTLDDILSVIDMCEDYVQKNDKNRKTH
jgi:DnaJ-class molecular chaperone